MGGRTTRLQTKGKRPISFANYILRHVTGLTIWHSRSLPSSSKTLNQGIDTADIYDQSLTNYVESFPLSLQKKDIFLK